MNNKINQKTKSSLIWNTFLPNVFQIYRFVVSLFIARILDPKDFGIMGIASIIIFYSNSLSDFGFSRAMIQKKNLNLGDYNSFFIVNFTISIILASLTIFWSKNLSIFFKAPELEDVLKLMSTLFLITSFSIVPETILKRELNFKVATAIETLRGFLMITGAIVLALVGYGYWSLVYSSIFAHIVGMVIFLYKVKWLPSISYDHSFIKSIFNFSKWNFILMQINVLTRHVDKIIIGRVLGPFVLGLYDRAFIIASMPMDSFSHRIGAVIFSNFARLQDNNEKIESNFLKAIIVNSLVCFPIFFGLFEIAPQFVMIVLGEKWSPMINSLKILLVAFSINSVSNIYSVLNVAAGNYKKQIKVKLYSLIGLIGFCLILTKNGINVVSLVVLSYYIIILILSFFIAKENYNLGLKSLVKAIYPALSGVVIMILAIKIFKSTVVYNENLTGLLLTVLIGSVTYALYLISINFEQTRFIKKEIGARNILGQKNFKV
jgi:PST family polysaccharide transporter